MDTSAQRGNLLCDRTSYRSDISHAFSQCMSVPKASSMPDEVGLKLSACVLTGHCPFADHGPLPPNQSHSSDLEPHASPGLSECEPRNQSSTALVPGPASRGSTYCHDLCAQRGVRSIPRRKVGDPRRGFITPPHAQAELLELELYVFNQSSQPDRLFLDSCLALSTRKKTVP